MLKHQTNKSLKMMLSPSFSKPRSCRIPCLKPGFWLARSWVWSEHDRHYDKLFHVIFWDSPLKKKAGNENKWAFLIGLPGRFRKGMLKPSGFHIMPHGSTWFVKGFEGWLWKVESWWHFFWFRLLRSWDTRFSEDENLLNLASPGFLWMVWEEVMQISFFLIICNTLLKYRSRSSTQETTCATYDDVW